MTKKKRLAICVSTLLFLSAPFACPAETLDVLIKGIYEGPKTARESAYAVAVMNAKLQAIERAGTEVTAVTEIENFTLKRDWVESRAKAVILPGFQILDMGYQLDGTYQVVFAGKVQVGTDRGKLWGKLRSEPVRFRSYKEAFEAWKQTFPGSIDNQYVNNENGTVMDVKTGLMWHFSYESADSLAKADAYVDRLNRDRFAGQNDWRMPTLPEISSLVEATPGRPLEGGRKSQLAPLFDARPYCWYLWSGDESQEGPLQVYVGEEKSGISVAGDHYQADNICVACVKAVRSMR
ncbi:MAG: DUF1566 domain-containing protein [Deltaproteobacteria bacterium]|nr:DUF1566 domain-containing protein [Deltaproteobacteria bacterium]